MILCKTIVSTRLMLIDDASSWFLINESFRSARSGSCATVGAKSQQEKRWMTEKRWR